MLSLLASLPLLLSTSQPASAPASTASQNHAQVSIATELATVAANGPFTIGVHFKLDPHWHIYWNGVNDTGTPPTVTLTLPEGWTHEPIQWPAPKRLVTDIMLDHVYEDEVTLLIEVTPVVSEGSAIPSTPQNIRADVSYMICSQVCVMEKASAAAPVNLTDVLPRHAVRSDTYKKINTARAGLPQVLPNQVHEEPTNVDGKTFVPIRKLSDDGNSLIQLGFRVSPATRLAFFPAEGCPTMADLIKDGESNTDTLVLSLTPPRDPTKATTSARLKGVLAVWSGENAAPAYYELR